MLFPDHDSIVEQAVLAVDVLEGRVAGYEHATNAAHDSRDEKGEVDSTKVVEV